MKVKIETEIARLTVDLTEEQAFEILGIALDYAMGYTNDSYEETSPIVPDNTVSKKLEVPEKLEVSSTSSKKVYKEGYAGFLYIKCEHCGKFKGFKPKSPITVYNCDCGGVTALKDLKEMYVECKCEKKFKYFTNATDSTITIECLSCGYPIDVEYNSHKNNYQTMK